jgi:serine O-acetyltransferase
MPELSGHNFIAGGRSAAGSVVLHSVPPKSTVAGVPARIVGNAGCEEPARRMDHSIEDIAGLQD